MDEEEAEGNLNDLMRARAEEAMAGDEEALANLDETIGGFK